MNNPMRAKKLGWLLCVSLLALTASSAQATTPRKGTANKAGVHKTAAPATARASTSPKQGALRGARSNAAPAGKRSAPVVAHRGVARVAGTASTN